MNAIPPPIPLIPTSAPFTAAQRAWLNGFLSGLYGPGASAAPVLATVTEAEEFPWHDPALSLSERQALAEGKPLARRLMAAMAQLDCGQCGYLCETYSQALAEGRESSASLCVPGGKETMRAVKSLLADAPAPTAAPAPASAEPKGRPALVRQSHRLTGPASDKDVRHVVIDLYDSGLTYLPGDSLGIAAPNDPALVEACITALGLTGDEPVPCPDGQTRPLRTAFAAHLAIARPLDRTIDLLAMAATNPVHAKSLRALSDGDDDAQPQDADLLDLLTVFDSARPPVTDLARSLPPLQPRLYSIASAPDAAPGEVHLCVSVVRETRRGRTRPGVASGFLGDRALTHGPVMAHVQSSHFRLPDDPATPVIMVGPGTGIAPFRAFLQHRAVHVHRGRAWLFFGDRTAENDFLYREELQSWLADGTLTRLDLAFSRDQSKKLYVQDRMAEAADDLWRWLQDGACFYVCGDATRMARDVDTALRRIAMRQGKLSEHQAQDWIVALARQGRYRRDVY